MDAKARPHQFHKSGDGQLGTRYAYVCDQQPIESIFDSSFFGNVRNQLLPADVIMATEVRDKRVVAMCEVMVVAKSDKSVEIEKISEVKKFKVPEKEPVKVEKKTELNFINGDGQVKWNPGKKKHQVLVDESVVAEFEDKNEAHSYARGDAPLVA